jgi:hypothetical protein
MKAGTTVPPAADARVSSSTASGTPHVPGPHAPIITPLTHHEKRLAPRLLWHRSRKCARSLWHVSATDSCGETARD